MQSKPQPRNWTDVQVVIAAVALTLTLGYWNYFSASAKKSVTESTGGAANGAGTPQADIASTPAPYNAPAWSPNIKILMGGIAPGAANTAVLQPSNISVAAAQPAPKKHKSGGAPVAHTKSS